MLLLKRDFTKTFDEDLADIAGHSEILKKFPIVPIDHGVQDWNTPHLYLTKSKLILNIDDLFEVYDLDNLEISLFGDVPKFTLWQQILEGSFSYEQSNPSTFDKIKNSENITRLGINEVGQITREFVLRDGIFVKKNYQTWAMAQIILNVKNSVQNDPILDEIIVGNFSRFNQKTVLTFVGIFILYFAFKAFALLGLPDLLHTLFDILFGVVLVAMLVWSILSINKNLDRYQATYNMYYSGAPRKIEEIST